MIGLSVGKFLIPQAALPSVALLLMVAAGFVLVFGARSLAWKLGAAALITLVAPMLPLKDILLSLVQAIPWWVLALVAIFLLLTFAGAFVRDVFAFVLGDLLASVIRWFFTSRYGLVLVAISIVGGLIWARFG